jgi:hypothetical protein
MDRREEETPVHWWGKGNPMPSEQYFADLTMAVLTDANAVNGFLQRQSPEGRQELVTRMYERITATFAQLST